MMRWLLRLSGGALLASLLLWLWNRMNQDLEEEEDLDDEIPFEFDVPLEDSNPPLASAPAAEGADTDRLAASVGPLPTMPSGVSVNGATQEASANGDHAATAAMAATDSATSMPAEAAIETPPAESSGEDADTSASSDAGPTPPSKGAQEGWNPHEQEEETSDAPPPGAGDNLIVIKGIGEVYSARLAEMGITTFGALMGTPVDTLAAAFPRVPESELADWIAQARELDSQEG